METKGKPLNLVLRPTGQKTNARLRKPYSAIHKNRRMKTVRFIPVFLLFCTGRAFAQDTLRRSPLLQGIYRLSCQQRQAATNHGLKYVFKKQLDIGCEGE
jgi:hypothetical protein